MNFSKHVVDDIDKIARYGFFGEFPESPGDFDFDMTNPMYGAFEKDVRIYENDTQDGEFDPDGKIFSQIDGELVDVLGSAKRNNLADSYYPELNNVLGSDVVIHSARNPRRERMAGLAIAAALGLTAGVGGSVAYDQFNQS